MAVPPQDLKSIQDYCTSRVPKKLRGQLRVECTVRGNSVTLVESRPMWADVSDEWVSTRIAQLRYDPGSESWSLYSAEGLSTWRKLEDLEPGAVVEMLAQIEEDRDAVFWG